MKNPVLFILICCTLLSNINQVFNQNYRSIKYIGDSQLWEEGILSTYQVDLSKVEEEPDIHKLDSALRKNLPQSIHFKKDSKLTQKFILPVLPADAWNDPGFFTVTAYFDHDSLYPDHLMDYQCGNLTYDLSEGYNHSGTDFFPWPFPWYRMYHNELKIIAAAPGILLLKQDGNFDQHCETNADPWNGVCILHEDGSTAWYLHMKSNSLTTKDVGQEIEEGELLGIVGSSGRSFAPHLHFEVYDTKGELIDPFAGPCNEGITESWWYNQLPYKEPGVNKITTNNHLPKFPDCPLEEIPNEKDQFYPNDTIFLLAYLKNLSTGDTLFMSIKRPDNSLFVNWIWVSNWEFQAASWIYFFTLLQNEPFGNWKYQIKYKNKFYEHAFSLLDPQGIGDEYFSNLLIYPNPAEKYLILEMDNQPERISLSDLSGRPLKILEPKVTASKIKLDLSDLQSGAYIIRVDRPGRCITKKIMIK